MNDSNLKLIIMLFKHSNHPEQEQYHAYRQLHSVGELLVVIMPIRSTDVLDRLPYLSGDHLPAVSIFAAIKDIHRQCLFLAQVQDVVGIGEITTVAASSRGSSLLGTSGGSLGCPSWRASGNSLQSIKFSEGFYQHGQGEHTGTSSDGMMLMN